MVKELWEYVKIISEIKIIIGCPRENKKAENTVKDIENGNEKNKENDSKINEVLKKDQKENDGYKKKNQAG